MSADVRFHQLVVPPEIAPEWCPLFLRFGRDLDRNSVHPMPDLVRDWALCLDEYGRELRARRRGESWVGPTDRVGSDTDFGTTPSMTAAELAEVHGTDPENIRSRARRGSIPGARKVGRQWLFGPEAVAWARGDAA